MISTKLRKDLKEIKPKVLLGMTKKEFIYNAIGLIFGLIFYNIAGLITNNIYIKIAVLILFAFPFIFLGYIKIQKHGIEKNIYFILRRIFNSKRRYYREENNYKILKKIIMKMKKTS